MGQTNSRQTGNKGQLSTNGRRPSTKRRPSIRRQSSTKGIKRQASMGQPPQSPTDPLYISLSQQQSTTKPTEPLYVPYFKNTGTNLMSLSELSQQAPHPSQMSPMTRPSMSLPRTVLQQVSAPQKRQSSNIQSFKNETHLEYKKYLSTAFPIHTEDHTYNYSEKYIKNIFKLYTTIHKKLNSIVNSNNIILVEIYNDIIQKFEGHVQISNINKINILTDILIYLYILIINSYDYIFVLNIFERLDNLLISNKLTNTLQIMMSPFELKFIAVINILIDKKDNILIVITNLIWNYLNNIIMNNTSNTTNTNDFEDVTNIVFSHQPQVSPPVPAPRRPSTGHIPDTSQLNKFITFSQKNNEQTRLPPVTLEIDSNNEHEILRTFYNMLSEEYHTLFSSLITRRGYVAHITNTKNTSLKKKTIWEDTTEGNGKKWSGDGGVQQKINGGYYVVYIDDNAEHVDTKNVDGGKIDEIVQFGENYTIIKLESNIVGGIYNYIRKNNPLTVYHAKTNKYYTIEQIIDAIFSNVTTKPILFKFDFDCTLAAVHFYGIFVGDADNGVSEKHRRLWNTYMNRTLDINKPFDTVYKFVLEQNKKEISDRLVKFIMDTEVEKNNNEIDVLYFGVREITLLAFLHNLKYRSRHTQRPHKQKDTFPLVLLINSDENDYKYENDGVVADLLFKLKKIKININNILDESNYHTLYIIYDYINIAYEVVPRWTVRTKDGEFNRGYANMYILANIFIYLYDMILKKIGYMTVFFIVNALVKMSIVQHSNDMNNIQISLPTFVRNYMAHKHNTKVEDLEKLKLNINLINLLLQDSIFELQEHSRNLRLQMGGTRKLQYYRLKYYTN